MSGAATLLLITAWSGSSAARSGSWLSAGLLALYAVPFAFSYTRLSAGAGALILFGAVQITMLAAAISTGERPRAAQWLGLGVAVAGLTVLVFPGLTAPSPTGAALMALAGVAWGGYSWRGRRGANPLAATTMNFVRATPLVLGASVASLPHIRLDVRGAMFAILSGALASGLGYVAWYAAVRRLSGMQAAVVQLSVPVLAAAGGVAFLAEAISLRLVASAVLVLGGIALAVVRR